MEIKKWHWVVGILVLLILPAFIGVYSFGLFKVFKPKYEDVKRDVFENTKSYMHGIQQDLGKYYEEYQKADEAGKTTIKTVIQARFAEVDAGKVQSPDLRNFLISMRGYK